MRLALISSITKSTNLLAKGGIEIWNSIFCLESAKRGHEIDLYAIKGSINDSKINLIEIIPQSRDDYLKDDFFSASDQTDKIKKITQFESTIYTKILKKLKLNEKKYDLIIDSASYPNFTFNLDILNKKSLIIGHFPIDESFDFYVKHFNLPKESILILPSLYQYNKAQSVSTKQKRLIKHGINISHFHLSVETKASMLWIGRIHKIADKGLTEAIKVALLTKRKLLIYGQIELSAQNYYEKKFFPIIKNNPEILTLISDYHSDKNIIFRDKRLFIFPIRWEEPFGLVMIESMACGTPVVAFARGSVPEIIKDGETGFIINPSDEDIRGDWIIKKTGIEGLCEAVERIYSLPEKQYIAMRQACRAHVEKNFTAKRMIDDYERIYQEIISPKC